MGFAFNRQVEALPEDGVFLIVPEFGAITDHQLRVEQAEMGEGMLGFLSSRFAEEFREIVIA